MMSLQPADSGAPMAAVPVRPPKFHAESAFARDLHARADQYLASIGQEPRDLPAMRLKTVQIWLWFLGSWAALVFLPVPWWGKILLALSQGLAIAGIGMAVMHDANHGAYSKSPAVNRWVGYSIDCMGASSFIWRTKHNTLHHTWTNVEGVDDDLEVGPLGRMSPRQRWLPVHRLQHLYMWGLYALLVPKWALFDDFYNIAIGRVGPLPLPKLAPRDWAVMMGGKALHLTLGFVIPMQFYDFSVVLAFYLLAHAVAGVTLAVTFQLAHCVDNAAFIPVPASGRLDDDWAVHQLRTTVDFAPQSKLLSWYLGGLNFQVVHHLFPKVCHIHYPALAKIVDQTARDHGLPYLVQPKLSGALASHYRWLREMGHEPAAAH
jgi:linoleoyl-CoA desaturase